MESYVVSERCGICLNSTTVCPISYKCGHKFCMRCVRSRMYCPNSERCPTCDKEDRVLVMSSSPIYYMQGRINCEKFYSDFLRESIERIEQTDLSSKIGRFVALQYLDRDDVKGTTDEYSYIGILTEVSPEMLTLTGCYRLENSNRRFYPTTPYIRRNIVLKTNTVCYVEVTERYRTIEL